MIFGFRNDSSGKTSFIFQSVLAYKNIHQGYVAFVHLMRRLTKFNCRSTPTKRPVSLWPNN